MTAPTAAPGEVYVRTYPRLVDDINAPIREVMLVTEKRGEMITWMEITTYTADLPAFRCLHDIPGMMLREVAMSRTARGTPADWYDALADWYDALGNYAERIFADNDIGANGHRRGEE